MKTTGQFFTIRFVNEMTKKNIPRTIKLLNLNKDDFVLARNTL